ncbi:hypothetical protein GCM10010954_17580 [Halobacillus andaensis]|uniref:Uroporphyrin-III C-methyltransferase n=1 Tax=Halobacillus andaensis TaxID=1176239 RepID=A0A917B3K6_HALAA|nr:DUF488 family protein [Halobacillus andaensis]MBP2004739.1 uncharacterized protein YeaO (DUF488 family) [Halobacillus andaensis]GGF19327.1 hypothetical protein GCM10010954_17580 [Halobacillus andaensis]
MSVILKRIYDEERNLGGHRILVDGIWPRGISKEQAEIDRWMKEISPSSELRKWFNHDPEKFSEFKRRYKKELSSQSDKKSSLDELRNLADGNRVILLYGAKDEKHNHALVLKELLEQDD